MAIYNYNQVSPELYNRAIRNNIIKPTFRISLLYPDETIREDITKYINTQGGALSINYSQGQRRSFNFTLDNSDGRFTPNALGLIWINTKFKLELGIKINGDTIYNSAGIFVMSNPKASRKQSQKTMSIQCYDKFSLLDGTLGGILDAVHIIPKQTNIRQAMEDILRLDNGNGYPIDVKPLIFDTLYINEKTVYTISKSPNDSLGSMLIELANMIGCDIWYDIEGNLVIQAGITDITQINKPVLWSYFDTEFEYIESEITYSFDKVKNRVVVIGSNINGLSIYSGIAENINPQSPTRASIIGIKNLYIDDSNISSSALAQQRAEYELNKVSILQQTIDLQSTYMIHLDVNSLIRLSDEFYNIKEDRFVIQSLNIPIGIGTQISISCSNIGTLPYYPTVV